jgi:hypothetical protein
MEVQLVQQAQALVTLGYLKGGEGSLAVSELLVKQT